MQPPSLHTTSIKLSLHCKPFFIHKNEELSVCTYLTFLDTCCIYFDTSSRNTS